MTTESNHENFEENEENAPESETQSIDDASVLQTRIIELEEQLADMKDKAMRALAEAENTRKRAERDKEDTAKYAISRFAKDLLEVADNMRRALGAVPAEQIEDNDLIKNIIIGIEATEKSMLGVFERNGITLIAPESGKFDPNLHEAMFEAEMEGKKPGEIIQLIEPGFALNNRLLRPARVGVAKGSTGKTAVDQEA